MNAQRWDTLYSGGYLVDPINGIEGIRDLAVRDGKIVKVEERLSTELAESFIDLGGKIVVPGIIDSHVHLSDVGLRMVAKAGVVTAIDFSGDKDTLEKAIDGKYSSGINVGFLKPAIPGRTLSSSSPSKEEQERFLDSAIVDGALGIKILGGHYPLEPDAFRELLQNAGDRNIFVAAHVGTTRYSSDIYGLKEAIELADGYPLYIAHVNSYCRGASGRHPVVEAGEAITLISNAPNITSESYVASINGTSGRIVNGIPASRVTRACLIEGGFSDTEKGMEEAIISGYALVRVKQGGEMINITGLKAAEYWRSKGTDVGLSFNVNSLAVCSALAVAKDADGKFIIDILSTDGGRIPRNTLITSGLAFYRMGALSLKEFVEKASSTPARVFGLKDKGHLGVGADADLTVLDLDKGNACMSVARGLIIMIDGVVVGSGGQMIGNPALGVCAL
jgi:hypothetical protein